ncbi:MAG TPA: protein kinase [Blastocatellia bacterium]|nr:protein kinase [Blastocatellia bacterium]
MTPQKYQRIGELFDEALERPPTDRAEWLREACGTDADLYAAVTDLLAHHQDEEDLLSQPALAIVAAQLAESHPRSILNQQLGHYRILSLLGAGGMGEVYLAEDTRLRRKVALKVLPALIAQDRGRLRRFEQEALAASALNHPNIVTIHEFGAEDQTHFIVTELVEGETLRARLQRAPLALDEALDIALQTAQALVAAHATNIIHRDIKPENVMLRTDGIVKVLDFGLAKLVNFVPLNPEPETRKFGGTLDGTVVGTVAYMSPEQARGNPVDVRTDLFSLGVLLYEMLTRHQPFTGETSNHVIVAILEQEPPPLAQFISGYPAELPRILNKALAKKCEDRYQTARDLLLDLKALRRVVGQNGELEFLNSAQPAALSRNENEPTRTFENAGGRPTTRTAALPAGESTLIDSGELEKVKNRYRKGSLAVVGLLFTVSLAYFGYAYLKPKKLVETAFIRTRAEKVPVKANVELVKISPDKKYLAYVERNSSNESRLVLRQTETSAEKEILPLGKSFIRDMEFSPDGNYFYYAYESLASLSLTVDIFRVPLLGGEPEKVVENIVKDFSVSPDGQQLAFVRGTVSPVEFKLVTHDLQTKQERALTVNNARSLYYLAYAPDGSKLAFFASDLGDADISKLSWISTAGGAIRQISETTVKSGDCTWLSDGTGLLVAAQLAGQKYSQIYKVSFPQGELAPLSSATSAFDQVSVAQDNSFLVARQINKTNGIWELDLATKSARQIVPTTNDELKVEDVTAAGRLLITRTDNKGNDGLWLMDADGANEKLLTLYNGARAGPLQRAALTNDETYCYYVSDDEVWRIKLDGNGLDGSGKEKLTNSPALFKAFGGLAPDSSYVLFNTVNPYSIQKLDLATKAVLPILAKEGFSFYALGFARNTNLVTYSYDDEKTGEAGLLLARFDGQRLTNPKPFVHISRTHGFVFSPDGTKVYFTPYEGINTMEMGEKDLLSGKLSKLTNFNIERIMSYNISRDGKRLYLVRGNVSNEIVLIRNVQ